MKENNNNTNNQFNSKELNTNNKAGQACLFKKMSCCKSLFSSKVCIAIIFALLGFGGATLAHNAKDKMNVNTAQSAQSFKEWSDNFDKIMQNQHQQMIKAFNNDPFFADGNNIFKQMAMMEQNMGDMFLMQHRNIAKIFDEAAKNSSGVNKNAVTTREDEKNYYYDLSFSGFKKEDIAVVIKDNNLTFTAKNDQDKSDKNQKLKSSANFYYSFSLPEYNAKIEPEIIKQDNKITVKLVKNVTEKTPQKNSDSKK